MSEKGLDKKTEALGRAHLNADLGNYNKAIDILEIVIPAIKKDDINFDSLSIWQTDDWVTYIDLLRLNKENQKADKLAQDICKFYHRQIETDSMMGTSKENEILLNCYYLSNDTLKFLKSLENRFFIKKDRGDVFSLMKAGSYRRFETHPGYQKLEERITAETHRMRAEVITYLKEEGDWDPAWDKELGLE